MRFVRVGVSVRDGTVDSDTVVDCRCDHDHVLPDRDTVCVAVQGQELLDRGNWRPCVQLQSGSMVLRSE